ncbi:hypothetical protein MGG_15802 [Pyricularia oryzae 70-15]|uniref:Uncharacterized protein n=3 Tax=Pyricularia oryzae TaxID=318829 RepID=G4MX43_PYRO7|nr:uncharacterized protein MGG_15802 [Pyricularia oryzae 70-15]EHA55141.1 hypothetical protein MGG_15802 [Pyricularia oryzae 70-15]ELQ42638.1 hypothetical protein OOU_Y34scaffold00200g1 [Pyricularia oryzae Y34]
MFRRYEGNGIGVRGYKFRIRLIRNSNTQSPDLCASLIKTHNKRNVFMKKAMSEKDYNTK